MESDDSMCRMRQLEVSYRRIDLKMPIPELRLGCNEFNCSVTCTLNLMLLFTLRLVRIGSRDSVIG